MYACRIKLQIEMDAIRGRNGTAQIDGGQIIFFPVHISTRVDTANEKRSENAFENIMAQTTCSAAAAAEGDYAVGIRVGKRYNLLLLVYFINGITYSGEF